MQSKSGISSWTGFNTNNEHIMSVAMVFPTSDGNFKGAVRFVTSLKAIDTQIYGFVAIVILIYILALGFVTFSGAFFVRTIVVPVRKINDATKEFTQGNFDVRIELQGDEKDEINELAESVNNMLNEVSATDKEVAEAVIGEEENGLDETTEIGMYLNIELFKEVVSDNEVAETQITETSGKITITIEIPEELINTDKSKKRTYRIIRIHEDETGNIVTDVIEGNFNKGDNSFSFKTDKFSTYAVVYNDKDTPKRVATGGGGGSVVYTVKFETNGGSNVEKKAVKMNETIAEPEAPVREGFEFGGWTHTPITKSVIGYNLHIKAYSDKLADYMDDLQLLFGGEK
jgi:HAMP domain-containing protein